MTIHGAYYSNKSGILVFSWENIGKNYAEK